MSYKIERYKINKETGCWNWLLGKNDGGYGYETINEKTICAHILSYKKHKGKIPEGFVIDHLCKNRLCINPDHLEAVTQQENVRRSSSAKINMEIARIIRKLNPRTWNAQGIVGKRFGVSAATIFRIIKNQAWKEEDATN